MHPDGDARHCCVHFVHGNSTVQTGRMRTPRLPRRPRSLAGQLFAMQVVLVAAVVAGCAVFAYVTDRMQAEESARQRASATAMAIADSPSVREAIRTPHPQEQLQPYAEQVRHDTGVTFITIMNTDGIRWTHPDSDRIGGRFLGHIGEAAEGRTFHETYTGTLGPSVRVVTPSGTRGGWSGSSARASPSTPSPRELQQAAGAAAVRRGWRAIAVGGLGTYVINARLRRHTHGMNAARTEPHVRLPRGRAARGARGSADAGRAEAGGARERRRPRTARPARDAGPRRYGAGPAAAR